MTTTTPQAALSQAAEILVGEFSRFTDIGRRAAMAEDALPQVSANLLEAPIEELDLPMRAYNSLKRNNITKIGQLLALGDDELLRMRNFGKKSLDEMKERGVRGFLPPDESTRPTRSGSATQATTRTSREVAHRIGGRKLGRKTGARKGLFKNLIVAVLRYEQIKTTEARAKEVRGQVERVITSPEGSLAARRRSSPSCRRRRS
jgi:hypothetical protein